MLASCLPQIHLPPLLEKEGDEYNERDATDDHGVDGLVPVEGIGPEEVGAGNDDDDGGGDQANDGAQTADGGGEGVGADAERPGREDNRAPGGEVPVPGRDEGG